MQENNRPALLAAARTILEHMEHGRIATTYLSMQNSAVCAIDLGWHPRGRESSLVDQVRALWPDGVERLQYRASTAGKRAVDTYRYVVDLDGCEIRVWLLKPHEHVSPTFTADDGVWRCGSCKGRMSKTAVRALGYDA